MRKIKFLPSKLIAIYNEFCRNYFFLYLNGPLSSGCNKYSIFFFSNKIGSPAPSSMNCHKCPLTASLVMVFYFFTKFHLLSYSIWQGWINLKLCHFMFNRHLVHNNFSQSIIILSLYSIHLLRTNLLITPYYWE
jgi:hypothetical protein